MSIEDKYTTVVFENKSPEDVDKRFKMFNDGEIVSMSRNDELLRLQWIEEALVEADAIELIESIFASVNVHNADSLDYFRGES